jgi:glucosamine--fructose-6-phosphate aminotransferase (isomerizing)
MCGIVGILGKEPAAWKLVDSLRRLEYRGYDSAGIAVMNNGKVERVRAKGKLLGLEEKLRGNEPIGTTGIGHTRWATHGAPTETNAHPHTAGQVTIVHNGIIENFLPLKRALEAKGVLFSTQTDTEVVAHLMNEELKSGSTPKQAAAKILPQLEGAFAFAMIFEGQNDLMIAARRGSPLAVGHGDGKSFVGSDAVALAPFTNRVTYLDDGDWAVLTRNSLEVFDEEGNAAERPITITQASSVIVEKGNYRHFMAKEIAEQPDVIGHTLAQYVDFSEQAIRLPEQMPFDFNKLERLTITACGTAYYAGVVAKYWFERYARLPVEVDIASEFRYREAPLPKNGLALVISQSGETADTLAALGYCKSQGQHIAAIVNVPDSSISRESDVVFRTFAGPEIGVASTKAFTCQLTVLACLAIHAGRQRGTLSREQEKQMISAMVEIPRHINKIFEQEDHIEMVARKVASASDVLFLGRGVNFPIALEGALKLKEISYIHAEGYAAGELKHGPIALIDEEVPVIIIAPRDDLFEKTVSNMEEVAARGAQVFLITDEAAAGQSSTTVIETLTIPDAHSFISPFLYTIPVQLLSYHAAVFMGTDVDQPRNLAKSVTVE